MLIQSLVSLPPFLTDFLFFTYQIYLNSKCTEIWFNPLSHFCRIISFCFSDSPGTVARNAVYLVEQCDPAPKQDWEWQYSL